MTFPRFALASRYRYVKIAAKFVNGKSLTHYNYFAKLIEHLAELCWLYTVDLEIPIFRLDAHQLIANTSADEHRAASRCSHNVRNIYDFLRQSVHVDIEKLTTK